LCNLPIEAGSAVSWLFVRLSRTKFVRLLQ
jgi:hypothetical protein